VTESRIVTPDIVFQIDNWVSKQLDDAKQYENSEPLDESGIYSLHLLAAQIYAAGFQAGEQIASIRQSGIAMRRRENAS
jgi:hypothetical protein